MNAAEIPVIVNPDRYLASLSERFVEPYQGRQSRRPLRFSVPLKNSSIAERADFWWERNLIRILRARERRADVLRGLVAA